MRTVGKEITDQIELKHVALRTDLTDMNTRLGRVEGKVDTLIKNGGKG